MKMNDNSDNATMMTTVSLCSPQPLTSSSSPNCSSSSCLTSVEYTYHCDEQQRQRHYHDDEIQQQRQRRQRKRKKPRAFSVRWSAILPFIVTLFCVYGTVWMGILHQRVVKFVKQDVKKSTAIAGPSTLSSESFQPSSQSLTSSYPRIWSRGDLSSFILPRIGKMETNYTKQKYEFDLPTEINTNAHKSLYATKYKNCSPKEEWHTLNYQTCNILHEFDFQRGVTFGAAASIATTTRNDDDNISNYEARMDYIASGGSRESWKVSTQTLKSSSISSPVPTSSLLSEEVIAFKNLRLREEYREMMYEHQRIDALSTERLTFSSHVVNIYGACGESVLNEYANKGDLRHYFSDRGIVNMGANERLVLARDASQALADIHNLGLEQAGEENVESETKKNDSGDNDDKREESHLHSNRRLGQKKSKKKNSTGKTIITTPPKKITTLVHHDIKPNNFLIMSENSISGENKIKIKIHDFNNAQLLTWNNENNKRCGFKFVHLCDHLKTEIDTAPEECEMDDTKYMSETVEVYRLGLILYFILTGIEPGELSPHNENNTTTPIIISNPPISPTQVLNHVKNHDKAILAIIKAMEMAFTVDMNKRPSAQDITMYLRKEVDKIIRQK